MKQRFALFLARLERMKPRERIIATLCACLVGWFLLDLLLVAPAQRDKRAFSQLLDNQRGDIARLNTELEGLRTGRIVVGDEALRKRLAEIEAKLKNVDTDLRASQQYLVPPERMSDLLQEVLRRDASLELVSVHSLPSTPMGLTSPPAEASAPVAGESAPLAEATPQMFRRGVQIVVRGDYLAMLRYLEAVEKLPWQMYWGRLDMEVSAGKPVFTLALFTLSLDKSWLIL